VSSALALAFSCASTRIPSGVADVPIIARIFARSTATLATTGEPEHEDGGTRSVMSGWVSPPGGLCATAAAGPPKASTSSAPPTSSTSCGDARDCPASKAKRGVQPDTPTKTPRFSTQGSGAARNLARCPSTRPLRATWPGSWPGHAWLLACSSAREQLVPRPGTTCSGLWEQLVPAARNNLFSVTGRGPAGRRRWPSPVGVGIATGQFPSLSSANVSARLRSRSSATP
jgi:hypothetical protein